MLDVEELTFLIIRAISIENIMKGYIHIVINYQLYQLIKRLQNKPRLRVRINLRKLHFYVKYLRIPESFNTDIHYLQNNICEFTTSFQIILQNFSETCNFREILKNAPKGRF